MINGESSLIITEKATMLIWESGRKTMTEPRFYDRQPKMNMKKATMVMVL
jgi:hypothetical protein